MNDSRYILVKWPFSQEFMEHPNFDECYLLQAFDEQEYYESAYFVPEYIYNEVNQKFEKGKPIVKHQTK